MVITRNIDGTFTAFQPKDSDRQEGFICTSSTASKAAAGVYEMVLAVREGGEK